MEKGQINPCHWRFPVSIKVKNHFKLWRCIYSVSRSTREQKYMVHSGKRANQSKENQGLMGISPAQRGEGKQEKNKGPRRTTVGIGEPSTSSAILAIVEIHWMLLDFLSLYNVLKPNLLTSSTIDTETRQAMVCWYFLSAQWHRN